jgi:hypothetical protein
MPSSKTKVQKKQIEIGDLIIYTKPTGEVYDVGLVISKAAYGDAYDVEWYDKKNEVGRYNDDFLLKYVHK